MTTIPSGPSHPTQFPNIGLPFVDRDGIITQTWFRLLINIWNRTGQALGGLVTQTGEITPFAGVEIPIGFLLCDGSPVSRKTYAALFSIVGTVWGQGDGKTTFNIPDLRNNVVVGASNSIPVGTQGNLAEGGSAIRFTAMQMMIKT